MKLYHFGFGLDYDTFSSLDKNLRYEFSCHVEFICHYMTKAIRKKRIETHGDFNGLYIQLLPEKLMRQPDFWFKDLCIYLPFDLQAYQNAKSNNDFSYYLSTIICGINKYAEFRKISVTELINIILEFERNGCQTKWINKKKFFREVGLIIEIHSELTTDYYMATAVIKDAKKNLLCQGALLKTEACFFVYNGLVKDIIMDNGYIFISDNINIKRFKFNISLLLKKIFSPKIETMYNYDPSCFYFIAGESEC